MKKMILILGLLLFGGVAKADDNILFNFGSVNVLLPFADVNATYLFDGVSKTSFVGAETPLVSWHKLELTGGAVTSIEGAGTPFIGLNIALENPLRNYTSLAGIKPGIFGGRNFNDGEYMVGFKASISIFN